MRDRHARRLVATVNRARVPPEGTPARSRELSINRREKTQRPHRIGNGRRSSIGRLLHCNRLTLHFDPDNAKASTLNVGDCRSHCGFQGMRRALKQQFDSLGVTADGCIGAPGITEGIGRVEDLFNGSLAPRPRSR
jgi:hypothetical protein